jgi:phenylacetate-coenzyme A ligase PaaK-like adenylate-forming protein/glycosyltransferase involved in cell wall biosynthesis
MNSDGSTLEISVIAPAYNEEANVTEFARRVLGAFDRGGIAGELILVDDGSSDGTARVIRELAKQYPGVVAGAFHGRNKGIAAAWKTGLHAARGVYACIIDSDLQYQPEDILRLHRTLAESNVDVVQGWRSTVGRERGTRYHLSRGFNVLLNRTFGMSLRDNKSGFVCATREVLEDLLTYEGKYFYWQSFIMVAAHAKGYEYKEIEVLFDKRRQGTSFLDTQAYRASLRSFVDLGRAVVEYRVRQRPRQTERLEKRAHEMLAAPLPPSPQKYPLRWRAYMATFDQTHWTITRDVERYYESLHRTQWLSLASMRELQDEKLRRLVRHAYRNVPYYRARMQEVGLTPQDIHGQSDLHKLPFLTKDLVRKHLYFDIMSENHDRKDVLRIATSGSTGEPFVCYADRSQLEFRWAATLRSQEWTGYRFGDPTVRLWHQTIGMSRSQVAREHADAAFANRLYIPIFEMSDGKLDEMIARMASKAPVLIDGYAEAFDYLAHYIASRGELPFKPKALMSSAQTLPAKSREIVEKAFGCRVFDKYGSREFSGIAYECEAHAGHHVVGEGYIVEVLVDGRPASPGEIGEIVITDLNNYCMPFIRYRIGDLAEAKADEPCTCGRGMARIGEIQGRVQSIIQGVDGRWVPGTFFAHCLKEYDHAIARFQIVQDQPGALRFLLVKAGRYSDDVLEEVKATFRRYLGESLRIDVEFVDGVDLIRTGKRLAAISKLPIDFQRPDELRSVG